MLILLFLLRKKRPSLLLCKYRNFQFCFNVTSLTFNFWESIKIGNKNTSLQICLFWRYICNKCMENRMLIFIHGIVCERA